MIIEIAELQGYPIEFEPGHDGTVETVIFRQPDGTYAVQRLVE